MTGMASGPNFGVFIHSGQARPNAEGEVRHAEAESRSPQRHNAADAKRRADRDLSAAHFMEAGAGLFAMPARFPILIRVADLDRFLHECPVAQHGAPATVHDGRWLPYFLSKREWGLAESYFVEQLGRAETTVLLDGLDEAADVQRRERMARIVESARLLYRRCQMVVTTRPSAYEGLALITGF